MIMSFRSVNDSSQQSFKKYWSLHLLIQEARVITFTRGKVEKHIGIHSKGDGPRLYIKDIKYHIILLNNKM